MLRRHDGGRFSRSLVDTATAADVRYGAHRLLDSEWHLTASCGGLRREDVLFLQARPKMSTSAWSSGGDAHILHAVQIVYLRR